MNITIKKNGAVWKTLSRFEYTEEDLGGYSLSVDVYLSSPEDFQLYTAGVLTYKVENFRGRNLYLYEKPSYRKGNDSLSHKYTLIFRDTSYELNGLFLKDNVSSINNQYSDSTEWTFSGNLTEFVARLNANFASGNGEGWTAIFDSGFTPSADTILATLSGTRIADCLQSIVYEQFGVRFRYGPSDRTIVIGAPITAGTFNFQYGYGKGLYEISRSQNSERPVTRISGVGGSRNVPYNYYANLYRKEYDKKADFPTTGDIRYTYIDKSDGYKQYQWKDDKYIVATNPYRFVSKNLMPSILKTTWEAKQEIKTYVDATELTYPPSESYPFNEVVLDEADDIYPTIKGATYQNAPIDELVEVPSGYDDFIDVDGNLAESYFDVKINNPGFNLASAVLQSGEAMKIIMQDGKNPACEFSIVRVNGDDISYASKQRVFLTSGSLVQDAIASYGPEPPYVDRIPFSLFSQGDWKAAPVGADYEYIKEDIIGSMSLAASENLYLSPAKIRIQIKNNSLNPYPQTNKVRIAFRLFLRSKDTAAIEKDLYPYTIIGYNLQPDDTFDATIQLYDYSTLTWDNTRNYDIVAATTVLLDAATVNAIPDNTQYLLDIVSVGLEFMQTIPSLSAYPIRKEDISQEASAGQTVTLTLAKDISTMGDNVIRPTNLFPLEAGDKFILVNADFSIVAPTYITNAEEKLTAWLKSELTKKCFATYDYTIKPSEIFLKDNPSVIPAVGDRIMVDGLLLPVKTISIKSGDALNPTYSITTSTSDTPSQSPLTRLKASLKTSSIKSNQSSAEISKKQFEIQTLAKQSVSQLVTAMPASTNPSDHALLYGRDTADQHPISAITNLQTILDGKSESDHTHTFASITSKPTTLAGYGITDAKIANGVITLGSASLTPLTQHQTLYGLTIKRNGTSLGVYTPNSAAKVIDILACTAITTPTGLTASALSKGVIALSLASGYSIPTTSKQTAWDSAVAKLDKFFTEIVVNGETVIQANYSLSSVGSLSAKGASTSGGGGGSLDPTAMWQELHTPSITPSTINLAALPLAYVTNGRNYKVESDGSDLYVNVPWTDTSYNAGNGISIANGIIENTGVRTVATGSKNGTIKVNTNGVSTDIAIKGLGTNAYTSESYQPLITESNKLSYSLLSGGVADITTLNVSEDITLENNKGIRVKATSGTASYGLLLDDTNQFCLGQGPAGLGYDTNIYGNLVRLRYGTSGIEGLSLDSVGTVSIANTLSVCSNRFNKCLAFYSQGSSAVTGTICITLPNSWSSTMAVFRIRTYEYTGDYSAGHVCTYDIGGYSYGGSSPAWNGYGYNFEGQVGREVRLGYRSGKCVILLGTTTSQWSYPQVWLEEVLTGFMNQTKWASGYSITMLTDESDVSKIVAVPKNPLNINILGNAVTATTATNVSGGSASVTSLGVSGVATLPAVTYSADALSANISAPGWYRVYVGNRSNAYGNSVILNVNRVFSSVNNESFTIIINIAFGGRATFTQTAGVNTAGFTKVRVDYVNAGLVAVDLYFSLSSLQGCAISGSGCGTFQAPTLVSAPTGNTIEFALGLGLRTSSNAYVAGVLTVASKTYLNGNVGIGTTAPAHNLHVVGDIYATVGIVSAGYISAMSASTTSDMRLKKDIVPLGEVMPFIKSLPLFSHKWKNGEGKTLGTSAQFIEASEYGYLTRRNHADVLSLEYSKITVLALKGLQEHETRIEALERENRELRAEVERLRQE